MTILKQDVRIPKNHEIKIKIPDDISENETVKVIIMKNDTSLSFKEKIKQMKKAINDKHFINDLNQTRDDFSTIDFEDWE